MLSDPIKIIRAVDFEMIREHILPILNKPKFLYENTDRRCLNMNKKAQGSSVQEFFFYISALDIDHNEYLFIDPDTKAIDPIYPYMFDTISREERDRFENEYGLTENKVSVSQEVHKKTENIYLELIQLFAGELLKDGLSQQPHRDAAQLIKKISHTNKQMPCSSEILAKYLKKNRI